ncbi:hypothetical protein WJX77_011941 [Trebouxia sp. C0004]
MFAPACIVRGAEIPLALRSQTCGLSIHQAYARPLVTCSRLASARQSFLFQATSDSNQAASKVRQERPPPWIFGFQTNERHLKWDESAQRQLLKMHVADKLGQEVSWVEDKLQEIVQIIPDLAGKVDTMKADIVMQLVSDTQAVTQRVMDLRELLPDVNVSKLLSYYPQLISQLEPGKVSQQLHLLRAELPGRDINDLLQREPLMLTANVRFALQELKRLTPAKDSADFLFKNPGLVLSMDEQMMESTIDGDLTQV